MPDEPIGFELSTPPDGFHGMSPVGAVAPASVSFPPSPSGQNPRFSSHIGSYHENGTYTSAASKSLRGSVMPACAYRSFAQSLPACGLIWSRRGDHPRPPGHPPPVDPPPPPPPPPPALSPAPP